ncbi:MAG: hypothetical protein DMG69_29115 [Acidobacteria bacterium]|nr:MAG: hypothetical protein DMG69_29115 [Acidobacteriota bacterium]
MPSAKKTKPKAKQPGKAASIADVARESGVSIFTVSAVINKKAHVGKARRQRVEDAIRKLNYRPNLIARRLFEQKTQTIGMIVTDIANPFSPWSFAAPRMPRRDAVTTSCSATVTTFLKKKKRTGWSYCCRNGWMESCSRKPQVTCVRLCAR